MTCAQADAKNIKRINKILAKYGKGSFDLKEWQLYRCFYSEYESFVAVANKFGVPIKELRGK